MSREILERSFLKMGARVKFGGPELRRGWRRSVVEDFSLDIESDRHGEYFLIRRNPSSKTELVVLDILPKDRHLLLLSRTESEKHRFLLGHDERHWFVAGIPEKTPVSRVRDAKRALKPDAVIACEYGLRAKELNRRANSARIRQGEWFFVPAPNVSFARTLVLPKEPLVRSGGGKSHVCDELCRYGGETVYVSPGASAGLTENEYSALPDAERKRWNWRVMRRNPKVYVRGRVRHPDHKTIVLEGWHEVFTNTEHLSFAMRNVVFLD